MAKNDVGYCRPPKHSRFKPGVSGNPKGRPRHTVLAAAEVIENILNAKAEYTERGIVKKAARWELSVTALVNRAVKGDMKAAEMLLDLRDHMERYGEQRAQRIQISDWMPDYPGQTAEQKTRETALLSDAEPDAWWQPSDGDSTQSGN